MSVNYCDIDSHIQHVNHIARLTRENAELRCQLQCLVWAAYIPLTDDDLETKNGFYKVLENEIKASEALLESI